MENFVLKILDKSYNANVDIGVARDMLINDTPEYKEELFNAFGLLRKYYNEITALRRDKTTQDIIKFVKLAENAPSNLFTQYMADNKDFFEQSFENAKTNK